MTEPETTTPPETDDGQPAGTPDGEGRNAQPDDNQGKLIAALQEKAAAHNRLTALMQSYGVSTPEELEAILAQPPAARDAQPERQGDDIDWSTVEQAAAGGNLTAKVLLAQQRQLEAQRERDEKLLRGISDAFTVRELPDKDFQKRVLAHYQQNKSRGIDLRAAIAEVRDADQAKEIERLKKELATATKRPDPNVLNAPPTGGRELTAHETQKRRLTVSQLEKEAAKLTADGRPHAAMMLRRDAEVVPD